MSVCWCKAWYVAIGICLMMSDEDFTTGFPQKALMASIINILF